MSNFLKDLNIIIKSEGVVEAVKFCSSTLKADPFDVLARKAIVRILISNKAVKAAIPHLEILANLEPDNVGFRVQLAKLYAQNKQMIKLGYILTGLASVQDNYKFNLMLSGLYGVMKHELKSREVALKAATVEPLTAPKKIDKSKLQILTLHTVASGGVRLNLNTFTPNVVEGHNNIMQFVDSDLIQVTRLCVDAIDPQFDYRKLGHIDVVYCSITDPEHGYDALIKAKAVCKRIKKPVVNDPDKILACSREGNFANFGNEGRVFVPRSIKFDVTGDDIREAIISKITKEKLKFPVLVRVAGFQNGKLMQKLNTIEDLDCSELTKLAKVQQLTIYAIEFVEFGLPFNSDIIYPKYRAFLVGDKLIPAHTRYGLNEWNVHMPEHKPTIRTYPWLFNDEEEFLVDPEGHIGADLWALLTEKMLTLGLDYSGVDFAKIGVGPEARLVIFEANPAMRNFADQQMKYTPGYHASAHAAMMMNKVIFQRGGKEKLANVAKISAGNEALRDKDNLQLGGEEQGYEVTFKTFGKSITDTELASWCWHILKSLKVDATLTRVSSSELKVELNATEALINALAGEQKRQDWATEVTDMSWVKMKRRETSSRGVRFSHFGEIDFRP
jgi:hypothetical protein